jgi:cellulose synthase/poly-beta-1,6-N-acetylglucosamine synthase-like glycosyltransferase/peptidoglycan hydrolase-like protein with peptidoglycan-binding domain
MGHANWVPGIRAGAASLVAALALLCLPGTTIAEGSSAAAAAASDATNAPLTRGVGFDRPDGAAQVQALQRRLQQLGQRPGPVDGLFGPLTEAAVERFQLAQGLDADGIVGPLTRRALLEASRPPVSRGAGYGQRAGSPRVRVVQRRLRQLGQRPGPVDGLFGPKTEAAVERFQRTSHLVADGVVGSHTLRALARAEHAGGGSPARSAGHTRRPEQQTRAQAPQQPASGTKARRPTTSRGPSRAAGREHATRANRRQPTGAPATNFRLPLEIVALFIGVLMVAVTFLERRADHRREPIWQRPPPDTTFYGSRIRIPRWRQATGRLASVLVAATGVVYLEWRLSTLHGTGAFGRVFYGAELLLFAFALLSAALLVRIRVRRGPTAPPAGTLDVFIPVCGEDNQIVEQTLRAALNIDYPHATYLLNDGRIAGKPNWRDAEALAKRYGVVCFTRTDGTRGKAGNLNHALALTSGEFIAVIDADHSAHPGFAREVLGYFADPRVAFVCTPQQFEGEAGDYLNNRELFFYRAIQPAKDAANCAFSCGNASTYRRAALASIGGISEWNVVEDLHTSYELHAAGWRSVYHPNALTVGTTPQTAAALLKQRLTWATDSLRILFWDNPMRKRGLSPMQRLHYLQTTGYYLVSAPQVLFVLGPIVHVLLGQTVIAATIGDYLLHSLPYFAATALHLLSYGGVRGGLRAAQGTLFMAPVFILGAFRAATGIRFVSGVTEKRGQLSRFSWLMLPQTLAAVVCMAAVSRVLGSADQQTYVSVAWAAYIVFTLAAYVTAISERPQIRTLLRNMARAAIVILLVLVLFLPHPGQPPLVPVEVVLLGTVLALAVVGLLRLRELRQAALTEAMAPAAPRALGPTPAEAITLPEAAATPTSRFARKRSHVGARVYLSNESTEMADQPIRTRSSSSSRPAPGVNRVDRARATNRLRFRRATSRKRSSGS